MTNRNQTDTNEMETIETKYQTDFLILPKIPIFNKGVLKIPIKYQENNNKFGTEIPNTYRFGIVFSWYIKFLVTD